MNTVNIYIHGTTDAWNESDHPRAENGQFGNRGPDPTKFPGYIKR